MARECQGNACYQYDLEIMMRKHLFINISFLYFDIYLFCILLTNIVFRFKLYLNFKKCKTIIIFREIHHFSRFHKVGVKWKKKQKTRNIYICVCVCVCVCFQLVYIYIHMCLCVFTLYVYIYIYIYTQTYVVYRDEILVSITTVIQIQADTFVSDTNGFINFWLRFMATRREKHNS